MKKYVPIILVVIIVLALVGWKMIVSKPATDETLVSTSTVEVLTASSTEAQIATVNEKEAAWKVLQNYLAFAKAKNLDGVASLSYQLSDDCKKKNETCFAKIESVYNLGKEFKEKDFKTIWSDQRQIILSSDWVNWDSAGVYGLLHSVIYFVKDNGQIKLLSFNPSKGVFVNANASSTRASIDARLSKATFDSDKDGVSDADEKCENNDGTESSSSCIKTNPNKRDSNGNGFWDGIEALFYK